MTTVESPAATRRSRFYVWMAGIFVLIAFGGFIPTYWAKVAAGTFDGRPILHVHGLLFSGWTVFFFVQTYLVATGRTIDHRAWGLFGIALATAMGFTVVAAAINSIKVAEQIGMGDQARAFTIVSLSGLAMFATAVTLAIRNTHRPDVHKRLMIVAMIPLMHAAVARLFATAMGAPPGPPPVAVALPPGLLVDLLLVAAMVFDWRTIGRVHPVYIYGTAAMVAMQILCLPVGASAAWMAIARVVESLAG